MPLNISKLMVQAVLVFSWSVLASAEVFEYSQNLYNMDSATCQSQASELAQKISQATGGINKSAYCAPIAGGGFDARILTEVAAQPKLEVAVFGFRVIVYDYPGRTGPANKNYNVISDESTYIHASECLAVLPKFEAHFRAQTGLDPISSQCAALAGGRYVPQIDAFGNGRERLFETSISLGVGSGIASEAMLLDVSNYLASVGGTPTNAARPSSFIQIKYYATQALNLTAYDFAGKNYFNSETECLAAVSVVQPILSQDGRSNLVSLRCGGWPSPTGAGPRSLLAVLDLSSEGQTTPDVVIYTVGHFPTYDECRAQASSRPRSYCAADVDTTGHLNGYTLNTIQ